MQYHEAANIFPLMEGDEFQALMEDIRVNGQREPICVHAEPPAERYCKDCESDSEFMVVGVEGNSVVWECVGCAAKPYRTPAKILDGRNRYSAILRLQEQKVNIEPQFRIWEGEGSTTAFVISLNLHRRHLNESQRAMIAESLVKSREGRPSKTASIEAVSQDKAAELLNVSRSAVQRAAKVVQHGDEELISAVKSGDVPVSTAAKAVDAAERYPQIARVVSRPHDRATIAENLDRLPESERAKQITEVVKGNQDTLARLANKPPMPKKRPPSAEDLWRDFFDDSERTLARLTANFEEYYRDWDYGEKEWFLGRLRDFIAALNDVEATALRSMDYDEGTKGTVSTTAIH